ncbi:MAG: cupin domain-containing protein [Nonomuraea sp.]|nr:cupin domain-containing protein [Nonomuraea sp.]
MSLIAVARGVEAETIGGKTTHGRLMLEASHTGGALSSVRMSLGEGADGATPHHHKSASEMFYVLGGRLEVLAGDDILTLEEGDMAVVPPMTAHAFSAVPGHPAELLIVATPGIERFEYFRLLDRLGRGEATLEELLASQDRFDNHFMDSQVWKSRR